MAPTGERKNPGAIFSVFSWGLGPKNTQRKRTNGMYRQRIQKARGHTAHHGWARLLLDRARDLIIHGWGEVAEGARRAVGRSRLDDRGAVAQRE